MEKIIITTSWDDGHILDIKLANLLKKYGIKGTFYISPESREITADKRLNKEQILKLSEDFEIGAHTMTHPNLEKIDNETARKEITESKKYLEDIIKREVSSFCYPSGYFNKSHKTIVKESGFTLARTVERFRTDIGNDYFALPTTIHTYRHWSDIFSIFKHSGIKNFLKQYINWDELAISIFDDTLERGGVFHLWGHSWEIEKNNDWERLEKVLKHISGRKEVVYADNAYVLSHSHSPLKPNTYNLQPSVIHPQPTTYHLQPTTFRNLLIVTPYFPPNGGGLERYAYEIATRLHTDHKWRVVVITSGEPYGIDSKEEVNGMTIYRLAYRLKMSNTPFSLKWFKKIRNILEEENPDIINIHTPVPGIGDITAMLAKDKPIVVTYHTGSMHKGRLCFDSFIWLYEHTLMKKLLNQAKHIVCASDFVRFNFLGKYQYKSSTITPAIDTNLFKPAPEKKTKYPSILFVAGLGRAEQHKGLQTLIEAMKGLQESIHDIQLVVVGDGDMRSEYEERVRKLGLDKVITFTGRLSGEKLAEQYQKAHIFALPTMNESFSMVILEAIASSLPVVATNVGGIPLLVEDGKTGFLISPNNSAILYKKLYDLLMNPGLSALFGNEGRNKIKEKFDWNIRSTNYDKIFTQTLDEFSLNNRIAIVVPYFYPKIGGLENYALGMAQALKRRGNDVFIITSNHFDKKWRYEEIEGMRIYRLPILFKISNTPINPLWLFWIRNILNREKPIIINAHMPVPYIADIVERVRGKIPFVLNYHNDLAKDNFFSNLLCKLEYLFLSNKTLRRADRIIATSEYYAKYSPYLKPVYKSISFVPPGVDTNRFRIGLSTSNFDSRFNGFRTILFVGQLDKTHRHKGLGDLLLAVSNLKNSIPNIKLIIVGRGNDISSYQKKAKFLKITNEVSFEGFVDDNLLPEYYAGADVLALPSQDRSEGFGMVIIEAAACGTPAVASNIGGIPAALLDEYTGLLVPPSNVYRLTEALDKILQNPLLAQTLGRQASERVMKEFPLPVVTQKFIKIIDEITYNQNINR